MVDFGNSDEDGGSDDDDTDIAFKNRRDETEVGSSGSTRSRDEPAAETLDDNEYLVSEESGPPRVPLEEEKVSCSTHYLHR